MIKTSERLLTTIKSFLLMKYIIKNFIQKIKNILNLKKKRYEEDLVLRGKILIEKIKNKTPIEINDINLKFFLNLVTMVLYNI